MKNKSRNSRKDNNEISDEDSDSYSTSSMSSSAISMSRQLSAVSIEDIGEALNQIVNDIEAKRATLRENGLGRFTKLLANRYLKLEIPQTMEQEILELLLKSIRRGGKECILSCQAIGLVWITSGENSSFQNVYELMTVMIKDADIDSEARSACCLTLALICWLQNADNSKILGVMDLMFGLLNDEELPDDLTLSILSSIGLLFTQTDEPPENDYFQEMMDTHMELLDSNHIEVRIAAGENLALMLDSSDIEYGSMGQLIHTANNLFKESSKYVAKKDRSAQKHAFRNIVESIKGGVVPETELKFGNQLVTFKGWEKLRQLEFLRNTIKDGLSVHFHDNPLIQRLFEWTTNDNDATTRRFADTTQGKDRAKTLRDQRASKSLGRNF